MSLSQIGEIIDEINYLPMDDLILINSLLIKLQTPKEPIRVIHLYCSRFQDFY